MPKMTTQKQQLTQDIKAWLDQKPGVRSIEQGALLLLRLSGNQIMFRNLTRQPQGKDSFVEAQLQKYYNFRVRDITHAQVQEMQQKVEQMPQLKGKEAQKRGKRVDHDSLPEDLQALYVENLSIVQRMREVHLRLRSLSLENAPCPDSDRYPFLKELISLDKKLRDNWRRYDSYNPVDPESPMISEDRRALSRKAQGYINLQKGRYKINPTDEVKEKLVKAYAQLINPTPKLTQELKELGVI